MPLPQSSAGAGIGQWLSPLTQSIQNSYAAGRSALMGFGQISGSILQNVGGALFSGIGNLRPQVRAMQPPVRMNPVAVAQAPQTFLKNVKDLGTGAGLALRQVGGIIKQNAPAALAFGGAVALSTAVCPCMSGALVGTAGIALGQHMLNHQ
jgi:hypothetical protein